VRNKLPETKISSNKELPVTSLFDSLKKKLAPTLFTLLEKIPEVPVTRDGKKYFSIACYYFIIKSQIDREFCKSYYALLKEWEENPYDVKQKNASPLKSESGWAFLLDEQNLYRIPTSTLKESKKMKHIVDYIAERQSTK